MLDGRERGGSQSQKDNLILLGVKIGRLNEVIDFLAVSSDPTMLLEELGKNHRKCDIEQFLFPVFHILYSSNPRIKASVQEGLNALGQFPKSMMDQYLTEFDEHHDFASRFDPGGKLDEAAVDRFVGAAQEVVFFTLKDYLGLTPEPKE